MTTISTARPSATDRLRAVRHGHPGRAGWPRFTVHVAEMFAVMGIGMGVFMGIAAVGYALAGTSLSAQPAAWRVLLMGIAMALPMALWMWWRGHAWAPTIEMAAAMLVPALLAAGLVVAGVLGSADAMMLEHVLMVPAMVGVMLARWSEYAHCGPHR